MDWGYIDQSTSPGYHELKFTEMYKGFFQLYLVLQQL